MSYLGSALLCSLFMQTPNNLKLPAQSKAEWTGGGQGPRDKGRIKHRGKKNTQTVAEMMEHIIHEGLVGGGVPIHKASNVTARCVA